MSFTDLIVALLSSVTHTCFCCLSFFLLMWFLQPSHCACFCSVQLLCVACLRQIRLWVRYLGQLTRFLFAASEADGNGWPIKAKLIHYHRTVLTLISLITLATHQSNSDCPLGSVSLTSHRLLTVSIRLSGYSWPICLFAIISVLCPCTHV